MKTERELFEEWMQSKGRICVISDTYEKGGYDDAMVHSSWVTWKARAALDNKCDCFNQKPQPAKPIAMENLGRETDNGSALQCLQTRAILELDERLRKGGL